MLINLANSDFNSLVYECIQYIPTRSHVSTMVVVMIVVVVRFIIGNVQLSGEFAKN